MDKWDYISLISKQSDKYGDLLLELMEKYNRYNLQEVTMQEVMEFYNELEIKENELWKKRKF